MLQHQIEQIDTQACQYHAKYECTPEAEARDHKRKQQKHRQGRDHKKDIIADMAGYFLVWLAFKMHP